MFFFHFFPKSEKAVAAFCRSRVGLDNIEEARKRNGDQFL